MNRPLSTVFFMMGITAVFIAMLAMLNVSTQARIQTNLKVEESKSILYAFGILPDGVDEPSLPGTAATSDLPWNEDHLLQTINRELSTFRLPVSEEARTWMNESMLTPVDTVTVYVRRTPEDSIRAFGFYLRGKGLWGTIRAFMAVNADFSRSVGIDFTDQVETPGLGARITEQEFKSYFRNLNIFTVCRSSEGGLKMVRNKETPNTVEATDELQAVTGATLTSRGVLNMLLSDLKFYYRLIRSNRERLSYRGEHNND